MGLPTGRLGTDAAALEQLGEMKALHLVAREHLPGIVNALPGLPTLTDADARAALEAHLARAFNEDFGPEEQRAIVNTTLEQFYPEQNIKPSEDAIMVLLLDGNDTNATVETASEQEGTAELDTLELSPHEHEIYLAQVNDLAKMYLGGGSVRLDEITADAEALGFLPQDVIKAVEELQSDPNNRLEIIEPEIQLASADVLPEPEADNIVREPAPEPVSNDQSFGMRLGI